MESAVSNDLGDMIGKIFMPGVMTGTPRTEAIDTIIQREKDRTASTDEVRAGIELVKAEAEITNMVSALAAAREHAWMILRWRKLYEDGELSVETALKQISQEAQHILGPEPPK